jgi:Flp pilus assembly protein TadG
MTTNRLLRRLVHDEAGGPLVEAAVLIPILFFFLFGAIDFSFLFYQWSAAAKAVEVGARIAAVSDPVASGLKSISDAAVNGANAGDPLPSFKVTCNGHTTGCVLTNASFSATLTYDPSAMQKIVYGRSGGTSCATPSSYYFAGMCNFFPGLTTDNVQVVYEQTGLGYVQSSDGPQPTVTVSLLQTPDSAARKFRFFFLGGLKGFPDAKIPPFTTTVTGEILSASPQP